MARSPQKPTAARWSGAALGWLWALAMGLLVCAPLLVSRGFALTRDMVFVPRESFKSTWLGLDGSVPRAVPGDAVVSLLSVLVPGDVLQKVVLLAMLVLAGGGAAVAVPGSSVPGRMAAATLYVWNPYVFERLAIGHWALLCAYAALPWVYVGSRLVRERSPLGWPALGLAVALAGLTSPTGGVLATVVCCCLLVGRDRRAAALAVSVCVGVNLPWIVPSLLYRGGIPADPVGVEAFAAHPDTPYGVVGSLLSLGGIWNIDVVPPGRDSWVLAGFMLLICVGALLGLTVAGRLIAKSEVRRLAAVGAVGLVLAALPALPGGLPVMRWVDVHVPGAGLLRDSQKWVALLALAAAVGVAALVTWLQTHWRSLAGQAVWWLVALSILVPVAVMPSFAWGLGGRLEPVSYPRDWAAVSALLEHHTEEGQGDVAVLPWSIYRQFGWNDDRPVLDPAPRFFPGDVVIADTLVVGSRAVAGEDEQAAAIGRLLRRGGDVTAGLRRLGVGLVVIERHTPGVGAQLRLHGTLAFDGPWLRLWVLGPPAPAPAPAGLAAGAKAVIVAGDVLAVTFTLTCLVLVASRALRRYSRR